MPEDTVVDTAVTWPTLEEAGIRVREMQTKLHRWAAADRGRRFDDVYNFVSDPATLVVALQRVAGNAGARTAGVDGVTAVHVSLAGPEVFLDYVRSLLKTGMFRPLPVRRR
jgi:RNA-directed DNA polymerase